MINPKLLCGSQKEKRQEDTLRDESFYSSLALILSSFTLGMSFVAISNFRSIFLYSRYGRNHT